MWGVTVETNLPTFRRNSYQNALVRFLTSSLHIVGGHLKRRKAKAINPARDAYDPSNTY